MQKRKGGSTLERANLCVNKLWISSKLRISGRSGNVGMPTRIPLNPSKRDS